MGQSIQKEIYKASGKTHAEACDNLQEILQKNVDSEARVVSDDFKVLSPRGISQAALCRVNGKDYNVSILKSRKDNIEATVAIIKK